MTRWTMSRVSGEKISILYQARVSDFKSHQPSSTSIIDYDSIDVEYAAKLAPVSTRKRTPLAIWDVTEFVLWYKC